jgi:hypothetical protein
MQAEKKPPAARHGGDERTRESYPLFGDSVKSDDFVSRLWALWELTPSDDRERFMERVRQDFLARVAEARAYQPRNTDGFTGKPRPPRGGSAIEVRRARR